MLDDYGANLFHITPIKDRVQINFSDMRDEHSLLYLVRDKDFIFNLAGQVSHISPPTSPLTKKSSRTAITVKRIVIMPMLSAD